MLLSRATTFAKAVATAVMLASFMGTRSTAQAIELFERYRGVFEDDYDRVSIEKLYEDPQAYDGEDICLDAYLMPMGTTRAGEPILALFNAPTAGENQLSKASISIDEPYMPALRRGFAGKHVRICGAYLVPPSAGATKGLYRLVRIDSIRILDAK
jgi:hypothetical protein